MLKVLIVSAHADYETERWTMGGAQIEFDIYFHALRSSKINCVVMTRRDQILTATPVPNLFALFSRFSASCESTVSSTALFIEGSWDGLPVPKRAARAFNLSSDCVDHSFSIPNGQVEKICLRPLTFRS